MTTDRAIQEVLQQQIEELHASAKIAENAMQQALSDLQWIKSLDEKTNLQSSILLLQDAIKRIYSTGWVE